MAVGRAGSSPVSPTMYIEGSFKGQDRGLSKNCIKVVHAKYTRELGQYQLLGPKTDDVSSILTPAAKPQYPSSVASDRRNCLG